MAYYAALASLLELLEDILHHDRYPDLFVGRQTIIKSLHQKLSSLEEVLQDFSFKGDEATDHVERLIRDAAYRAQDIIELEITKHMKEPGSEPDMHLKNVGEEIDAIVIELTKIKESHSHEKLKSAYDTHDTCASEQAPSGRNTMVGFDAYSTAIKEQLCGQSSQLQFVSIVGTGGIGKTTLARNAFDDRLIKDCFDYRAWVTVSQDYDAKRVVLELLKSLGFEVDECSREEEHVLKEKIYKYLKGRKYLVIIDDIWNRRDLDDLSHTLPNDGNGSRILLTTRLLDIAQYRSISSFVHQIDFLNEEDSWKLFKEMVFTNVCCPLELEDIGKSIASKCYGLPIAIVVIAGMLSNVRLLHDWEEIERNMGKTLSGFAEHLFDILSLSYNHLSHQLKACFLHMSSFPEDWFIGVEDLIGMWIAEGFLRSSDKSKTLEEVAEECVKNLVKRNLVIITKKTPNGKFKYFVLHDLVRNFCKYKAFNQKFLVYGHKEVFSYPGMIENARRAVYVDDCFHSYPCRPGKLVRSLIWFHEDTYKFWKLCEMEWGRWELLRILDVNGNAMDSFSDAISRLFHLRYLNLPLDNSETIIRLPSSIWALQNLQTIVFSKTKTNNIELPPEIWKMTQLRAVEGIDIVLPPLSESGDILGQKLEYLQRLVVVTAFVFTDDAIEMIPNVKQLTISYEQVDMPSCIWKFYCLHNLVRLYQLEELHIRIYDNDGPPIYVESSLIEFTLPLNIRSLILYGCQLPWKYMKVVGSLPRLQVLKLKENAFQGTEWKPTEGEFCHLKFLLFGSLDLKYWRADNTHFPCLQHLKIKSCNELEIPLEIGDIPSLKIIEVFESERAAYSAMRIKEEQQDQGNDTLLVDVITG